MSSDTFMLYYLPINFLTRLAASGRRSSVRPAPAAGCAAAKAWFVVGFVGRI